MKDKSIQELINLYHSGKLTIVEKKVIELIKKNPKSFVLYNLFGAVLSNQKNFSLREESKTAANKYLYNNLKALKEFEQFLEEAHTTTPVSYTHLTLPTNREV